MRKKFIINDYIGKQFTRLTILKQVSSLIGTTTVLTRCSCGVEKKFHLTKIVNNIVKSCGCYIKEKMKAGLIPKLPMGVRGLNEIYKDYKQRSIKKKQKFELNKIQFKILLEGACYYCGVYNYNTYRNNKNDDIFYYNGIDRVDNKKGYELSNVVSCCKICNYMKYNFSQSTFLEQVSKITNYQLNKLIQPK